MGDLDALRDRYRGVLLASAAGDALGATVEFLSPADIRSRYGVLRDIVGGGWLRLPAGEVTDDTQMARCIARSIVETGGFNPADIAARFVEWYRSNPPDIGNTTRHALRLLGESVGWDEAGERTHLALQPKDASNGSLMRTSPVALLTRGDPAANAACSRDASRITHANPRCQDACVAFDAALAAVLDDPAADILSIARAAASDADVAQALANVPERGVVPGDAGGSVLSTLQCAFWANLTHDTLEDAVVAAVNLGQDADTTGAVAGALAGARWGVAAIPDRWLAVLRGGDELIALADGLLELSIVKGGG
jgi:ADP-ribosyl-[dinitrogen reductase] hydrolase